MPSRTEPQRQRRLGCRRRRPRRGAEPAGDEYAVVGAAVAVGRRRRGRRRAVVVGAVGVGAVGRLDHLGDQQVGDAGEGRRHAGRVVGRGDRAEGR